MYRSDISPCAGTAEKKIKPETSPIEPIVDRDLRKLGRFIKTYFMGFYPDLEHQNGENHEGLGVTRIGHWVNGVLASFKAGGLVYYIDQGLNFRDAVLNQVFATWGKLKNFLFDLSWI